jgi:hypothetical protein
MEKISINLNNGISYSEFLQDIINEKGFLTVPIHCGKSTVISFENSTQITFKCSSCNKEFIKKKKEL